MDGNKDTHEREPRSDTEFDLQKDKVFLFAKPFRKMVGNDQVTVRRGSVKNHAPYGVRCFNNDSEESAEKREIW